MSDEHEELLNQLTRIKKEITKLKHVTLALWDNERDIGTQKLIEQFRIEVDNIKGE